MTFSYQHLKKHFCGKNIETVDLCTKTIDKYHRALLLNLMNQSSLTAGMLLSSIQKSIQICNQRPQNLDFTHHPQFSKGSGALLSLLCLSLFSWCCRNRPPYNCFVCPPLIGTFNHLFYILVLHIHVGNLCIPSCTKADRWSASGTSWWGVSPLFNTTSFLLHFFSPLHCFFQSGKHYNIEVFTH